MLRRPPALQSLRSGTPSSTVARKAKPSRRRSTKRKRRSENPDNNARNPLQERSRLRYEAILDATNELLQTTNIESISLYDIANKARMPAASVHYLFPTVDAVYVKLAGRYMHIFAQTSEQFRTERRVQTWQENIRSGLERGCKLYNENRGAMELLLGPRLGRVVELEDIRNNDIIAESILNRLQQNYVMPPFPDLQRILSLGITIGDSFWSRSYIEFGKIDEGYLEQSVRAVIAYLSLYLPNHLPRVD